MIGSASLLLFIIYQGIQFASNIWLAKWTGDSEIYINGTRDNSKLGLYIEVYGILGLAQGDFFYFYFIVTLN